MKTSCILTAILILFLPYQGSVANIVERPEVNSFIQGMVEEHGYDAQQLEQLFSRVEISKSILEAISRPAEALPWYKYQGIFIKPDRIRGGAKFWTEHRETLQRASDLYGIPSEIMVAIIGVETRYGSNTGSYKVINSLSTLAFDYPKRSSFFTSELEHYLLLTREQGLDPYSLKGSYAGAMGIPQFISSSYRNYAIDFDGDGKINIWDNPVDAIGSVANYFSKHGWKKGQKIILAARASDADISGYVSAGLEPDTRLSDLINNGIYPGDIISEAEMVKVLQFENREGYEYWLALQNFYVITRYNHSALYAMAVFQLANEIRSLYQKSR